MDHVRRLLALPSGKIIAVVLSLCVVGLTVSRVVAYFQGDTPASAFNRMYICSETGKPFKHTDKVGEAQPIYCPYSHKNTGVPAEACYWTADGGIKKEPTWVLLNELAGKPGPTYCPDCGRLVVGHNPAPGPGVKPPPTRFEQAPSELAQQSTADEQ